MGNSISSKLNDNLGEVDEKLAAVYTLRNIYYCRDVLSGFAKSKTGGATSQGVFNHDYLLLELCNDKAEHWHSPPEYYYDLWVNKGAAYAACAGARVSYMVAEKRSSPDRGIILSWCNINDDRDLILRAHRHATRFPCHIGPPLAFPVVRRILRGYDVSYNVFWNNCWHYAQAMTWNLLTECIRTCEDQEEKDELKERLISWSREQEDYDWMHSILVTDLEGGYVGRKTG